MPPALPALFLHPKPAYTLAEAAELVGMGESVVREWVEVGELETRDDGTVGWAEVVLFALDLHEQGEIEAVLGDGLDAAIPELWRLTELRVRVPRVEVVALERVAAREGRSVDSLLGKELLDFVSVHAEWLSAEVPGLAAALAWPGA